MQFFNYIKRVSEACEHYLNIIVAQTETIKRLLTMRSNSPDNRKLELIKTFFNWEFFFTICNDFSNICFDFLPALLANSPSS